MDLSDLNSAEMQKFYSEEQQRAMVNEMVAKLTSECWDKCITGTPGNKFSSSEHNCLSNCAQRYLEMSMLIMKRFQGCYNVGALLEEDAEIFQRAHRCTAPLVEEEMCMDKKFGRRFA